MTGKIGKGTKSCANWVTATGEHVAEGLEKKGLLDY